MTVTDQTIDDALVPAGVVAKADQFIGQALDLLSEVQVLTWRFRQLSGAVELLVPRDDSASPDDADAIGEAWFETSGTMMLGDVLLQIAALIGDATGSQPRHSDLRVTREAALAWRAAARARGDVR